MTAEEDLEVRCLISAQRRCEHRVALKEIFGWDIPTECPFRKLLQTIYHGEEEKEWQNKYAELIQEVFDLR